MTLSRAVNTVDAALRGLAAPDRDLGVLYLSSDRTI